MPNIDDHELLRSLAYQSWLDRGQPFGSPDIDWLHAQEQVQRQAASITSAISGELQADGNSASTTAQLGDTPPNQQRQQQGDDQTTDASNNNVQTETTAASVPTINDAVTTSTSTSRSNARRLNAEVPLEVPPSPTTPPDQQPTKAKSERSSLKKATSKSRAAHSGLNDGSRL